MSKKVMNVRGTDIHQHHIGFALVILAIIFLIVFLIVNGAVEEYDQTDKKTEPAAQQDKPTESAPAGTQEPSTENVTGGSSAGGTGESNDATTPSTPAGGVDTNNYQTP